MRVWIYPIGFMAIALLSGCAFLDGFFGTGKNPTEHPPSETVATWLNYLIPGSGGLLGLARWGYVEVRKVQIERAHATLVAAGKKDEDNDGVEDAPPGVTT